MGTRSKRHEASCRSSLGDGGIVPSEPQAAPMHQKRRASHQGLQGWKQVNTPICCNLHDAPVSPAADMTGAKTWPSRSAGLRVRVTFDHPETRRTVPDLGTVRSYSPSRLQMRRLFFPLLSAQISLVALQQNETITAQKWQLVTAR